MKIFGRKVLDYNKHIELPFDDVVFVDDDKEIVVSLYRARENGTVEVRANDGVLVVLPRAANVVEIERRRL